MTMEEYIKKYWKHALAVVLFVIVVVLLYTWWKKKDETTIKVVDDQGNPVAPTAEQLQAAAALADDINADLNSGWFFGYNVLGAVTRNDEAYTVLAGASDTIFALTCQAYFSKYNRSLISDIRAESSLDGRDFTTVILAKAAKLRIT